MTSTEQQLRNQLGGYCVKALKRAFQHPYIKLDEAGTFDDLIIDELDKAFRHGYASRKTFRALARMCYIALITEGIEPEKLKYWYGVKSQGGGE